MANTGENAAPKIPMKDASIQNGHDLQSAAGDLQREEPNEADITEFIDIAQKLEKELTTIVIGQEMVVRELLLALLAGGHVLLEGMQERTVSVVDATRPLPKPFFVLATQNPLEMEGTYALPEAQLDRFLLKIMVRFPNTSNLLQIIDSTVGMQTKRAKQVASGEQLARLIDTAKAVPVATHLKEYAVRLLLATHPETAEAPEMVHSFVRYGASPRGLQAMIMTSKVRALLEGRFNVSLVDIQAVDLPALRHRLILNFDGLAEGITAEEVIGEIIKEIEDE